MSLILLSTLFGVCWSALTPAPGSDIIGRGYNILTGNPHDIEGNIDIGFKGHIFNTSIYTDGNKCSLNGITYSISNGVSCSESISCVASWHYTNSTSMISYSEQLSKSVKASAKFGPFQFGASKSYQSVYEYMYQQHKTLSNAYSKCAIYIADIQKGHEPTFTKGFINTVKKMPLNYSKSTTQWFYDFLTNDYGTHYIQKIQFGAEFGETSFMNWYSYDTYLSSTYNLEASAKWLAAVAGGLEYANNEEKEEAERFQSYSSNFHTYSLGPPLPKAPYPGNTTKWLNEIYKSPVPVYMEVTYEIYTLLQDFELWNGTGINSTELRKKANALEKATNDYCTMFKDKNPSITSIFCNNLPPNNNPKPSESVFKGFYSDISGVVNPYTKKANCPAGYQSHRFSYWSSGNGNPNWYYCLNSAFKAKNGYYYDPMHAFGGIYTEDQTADKCIYKDGTNGANPFTGKCACGEGYQAERFMIQKGGHNANKHYWYTWWCRNNTGDYHDHGDRSIIGGFVQTGNIVVNNQFTGTSSCPDPTQRFSLGQWQCNNDGQHKCMLFTCLSNVFS